MKYFLTSFTCVFLFFTLVFAFSNEEIERLDRSDFENPRRPGAVFAHDDHNETAQLDDCSVCHHVYEGGTKLEDESSEDSLCSECHFLKPSKDNSIPLEVAFHKRCKECHFENKKGPVFCGECHIKEQRGEQ